MHGVLLQAVTYRCWFHMQTLRFSILVNHLLANEAIHQAPDTYCDRCSYNLRALQRIDVSGVFVPTFPSCLI